MSPLVQETGTRRLRATLAATLTASLITAALFISFAAPASATLPQPLTSGFLDSEPGETLAAGQALSFTDVTVAPISSASLVRLNLASTSPSHSFQLTLQPDVGDSLAVGTYEGASKAPSLTSPGLDLSGDSHVCTSVSGRFIIDEISFSSGALQSLSARFEQHCNDEDPAMFGVVSFNATADYRAPTITPSTGLSFGNLGLYLKSTPQDITITNAGPSDLTIDSASITGPNAPSFDLVGGTCLGHAPLAQGDSCTYSVRFTPVDGSGARSAKLTIFDDLAPQGGSGRDIPLSGNALPITAAWIDGEVNSLYQGAPLSLTPSIDSNSRDDWVSVSLTGPGGYRYSFEVSAPVGQSLSTGVYDNALNNRDASHPGLQFGACGGSSGRFIIDEITLNGSGAPTSISVRFEQRCNGSATGYVFGVVSVNASAPYRTHAITPVTPHGLDFGAAALGHSTAPQQVTVQNQGPSDLHVSSASITGTNAGDFEIVGGSCPNATLAPTELCTYSVRFAPTSSLGTKSAQLVFHDELAPSAGAGRHIPLTGSASASVNEATLDSEQGDAVGGGTLRTPSSVSATTYGANGIELDAGTGTAAFHVRMEPPTGQTLTVGTYENAAKTADATHASLDVSSSSTTCTTTSGRFTVDDISFDGSGNVQSASVRFEQHCDGADPALFGDVAFNAAHVLRRTITPSSHDFGSVIFGQNRATSITIENTGSSDTTITVRTPSIQGADAASFSISPGLSTCTNGIQLTSGQSCDFRIVFFSSGPAGPRTAKLNFFDDLAPIGGTGRDVLLSANAIAADPTGEYTPLTPARILDTRTGTGHGGKVGGGQSFALDVTGIGGVPDAGVSAVVMNVTVTDTNTPYLGYVTVYPDNGGGPPLAANLNFAPNQTVGNLVTVKVGANGSVRFYNAVGSIDLVADIAGYYTTIDGNAGSRFHGLTPSRLFDTRGNSRLLPNGEIDYIVPGHGGVPGSGATAVVLNVTATAPNQAGWVTVFPGDVAKPGTASLTYGAGQTVLNLVIVRLPANGVVKFANGPTSYVDLVVDVVGFYDLNRTTDAGRFVPLDPVRFADTRDPDSDGPLGPDEAAALDGVGYGGVPSTGVSALVMNVTVTQPTATGWITVWPPDQDLPLAASVVFVPGQTVPNLVMAKLSDTPGIEGFAGFYNAYGYTHLVIDVSGYFTSA